MGILHEAEQGSFRQEVVCVSAKMWFITGLTCLRAETSCEEIENQVKCYKKKKKKENQQLGVSRTLSDQCLISLNGAPFLP